MKHRRAVEAVLCIHGRARHNPGMQGSWAALSYVVYHPENEMNDHQSEGRCQRRLPVHGPIMDVREGRGKTGMTTNNQADYVSVLRGLELLGRQLDMLGIPKRMVHVHVWSNKKVAMRQLMVQQFPMQADKGPIQGEEPNVIGIAYHHAIV